MTAKKWIVSIFSLFALTCSMLQGHSSSSSHRTHSQHKVVKYVKGDACYSGEGTKHNPYATLADAEADTSWDILVVLPSVVALDGGITLRTGTKLLGCCDPTCGALAPNQPTITNSSDTTNGGNGVVVTGDAVIGNIHFKDSWASAINFDDGRNVTIKQVLITGHNQGEVVSQIALAEGEYQQVAGIHGQPTNDGKTVIEKVIIRNNHTGSGINNFPLQGAIRHLFIHNCEVAELTFQNSQGIPNIVNELDGIATGSVGVGTKLHTVITNSYIHNFQAQDNPSRQANGISCLALNGGREKTLISCCTFSNIHDNNQIASCHIFTECFTDPTQVVLDEESLLKLEVKSCLFEESSENFESHVTAVQNQTMNGKTHWTVKNCTSNGLADTFVSYLFGSGKQKEAFINNTAFGFDAFYTALSGSSPFVIENPKLKTSVCIEGNNYAGGFGTGAIAVIANVDGSSTPWDKLRIYAKGNCFDGLGSGQAGLFGTDFGSGGAGNASIFAHKNSIVGFNYGILDNGANVNYFAQKNWWGPSNSCQVGSDCSISQSCSGGQCVGPQNVVNNGTGIVNVSHPLNASIKCPGKCHFPVVLGPQ